MEKKTLTLTILMPCLNEEATIRGCIRSAMSYLEKSRLSGEILVIDNGSSDQSVSIAKEEGARVEIELQKGYGNALRCGIQKAKGKYIIMGDCDGSYDFSDLDAFLENLEDGYALVMGNRMHKEMKEGAMPALHRYIGVPFLSWLGRRCCHADIKDFHCGLRGFRRDAFLEMNLQTGGMEFASEMIKETLKSGHKITQVPIILYPDKRNRKSHLRPFRDGIRHIKVLIGY